MIRKIFGQTEDSQSSIVQMEQCLAVEPETAIGALMGDHHKGYSMPIGGVVGYVNHISPAGVGFDIGCGNLYAETPIDANDVDIPGVMEEIRKTISFGIGRPNGERIEDHPVFDKIESLAQGGLSMNAINTLMAKARAQLGTVGSGNHYVDLFENRATGKLGVGVHFGSRGLGHSIASGYLAVAQGKNYEDKWQDRGMDAPPEVLRLDTPAGQDYEHAMNVALAYAYAGREWVVDRIIKGILGSRRSWDVHNNHNYASREWHLADTYGPRSFMVHRKGATPAFPGQFGFVGATMGEDAVIVKGIETDEAQIDALYSTVHGAGRVMSRTQAAGKVKIRKAWKCSHRDCPFPGALAREFSRGKNGELPKCPLNPEHKLRMHQTEERIREGLIDWEGAKADLQSRGIYLIGAGADEAPGAYKRLSDVLKAHEGAIEVVTFLRPLGVAMAGPDVQDPYKD